MKKKRLLWLLPLAALVMLLLSGGVYAIEYSGEAGAGTGTPASGNYSDFCLLHAGACDHNSVIGYRFTVVDQLGSRRGRTVDIYRDRAAAVACASSCTGKSRIYWYDYGCVGFSLLGSEGSICGKLENRAEAGASGAFSLQKTSASKYRESELGLDSFLPVPSLIGGWIENEKNAAAVSTLCIGGTAELNYGDIIIIEPVLSCRVENCPCGLTASDLARLGLSYYGDTVPAEISGGYGFAWLRTWVYRTYPNLLSVTDRSRAALLGLNTGTKLLVRAAPSVILEGAYGMGMGIELSKSQKAPLLQPLRVEAIAGETLLERSDNPVSPEIVCDYLESGHSYRLRVYFSEETSTYRVQRSWWIDGAAQSSLQTAIGSSAEPFFEIAALPTGNKEYIDLHIREDWVSENNKAIQSGEEKVFRLSVRPALVPQIIIRDRMEKEVNTVYRGQRVHVDYQAENKDNFPAVVDARGLYEEMEEGLVTDYLLKKNQPLSFGGEYHTVMEGDFLTSSLELFWKNRQYPFTRRVPVVIADLAVAEIEFHGADGALLNSEELPADMPLTPVLLLQNLTETTVYATVYAEGEALGAIVLEANAAVRVEAPAIVRRTEGYFTYTAEIYLEGQDKSAELESDPFNNRLTVGAVATRVFCLTPLDGSPSYHTDTDVFTTLRFYNRSTQDFSDNGSVRMTVYAPNGERHCVLEKPAICPAGEDSYLYFGWHVDKELQGRCKIVVELSSDGGRSYLPSAVSVLFAEISELPKSVTPDTVYEAKAPAGFSVPSAREALSGCSLSWYEWSYEDGSFAKHDYRARVAGKALIWPITGLSARKSGDHWIVRSGYGLAASVTSVFESEYASCTDFQNAYALFPEYDYRLEQECFTTLTAEGRLEEHFMPLWYPDGPYTVLMTLDDLWTPGGKIVLRVPASVSVLGSLYDDRYIGR